MGSNGMTVKEQMEARNKCPDAPTKAKYLSSDAAWTAANKRAVETGLDIVAYACPGCGFFHLTKKADGSDIALTKPDGTITTPALKAKTPSVVIADFERVEPDPETLPPGNKAMRDKVLDEWLVGKTEVKTEELCEVLNLTYSAVGPYMRKRGWYNTRGVHAVWLPEKAVNPIVPIKPEPVPASNPDIAALYKHREDEKELSQSIARHPAGKAWRTVNIDKMPITTTLSTLVEVYEAAGLELRLQVADHANGSTT